MNIGIVVRVVRISDPEYWEQDKKHHDDYDPRVFIGRLGLIRDSSEGMLVVEFTGGDIDAFYPEEIELVKALNNNQRKPNLYRGRFAMTPFQKKLNAWIKKVGGVVKVQELTGIPKETMNGWTKRGSYPREDLWELLSTYVGMSVAEIMMDYGKRLQYRRKTRPSKTDTTTKKKKPVDADKKSD